MSVTIDMLGLIIICGFVFCLQAVLTLGWMITRLQLAGERTARTQAERQLYTYKRIPFQQH